MAICPVAIAAGCKKCVMVSFCPLKTVLGDYGKEKPEQSAEPKAPDPKS